MKDKVQFVLIAFLSIVAFILFFGFVLSNIDPNNKLEAYTLGISFVGIFATFGGAYLGAKISAKNAVEIVEIDRKANKFVLFQTLIQIFEKYDDLGEYYGMFEQSFDDLIKYSSHSNIKKNIIRIKGLGNKNEKYNISDKYDEILSLFDKIIADKYLYYFLKEFEMFSYEDLVYLKEQVKSEKKEVICYFNDTLIDNKKDLSEFLLFEQFKINHRKLCNYKTQAKNIIKNKF